MRTAGSVIIFLVLFLSGTLLVHAQDTPSIQWIKVQDSAGDSDSLLFGNVPGASYGVDASLGENSSPPLPPGFSTLWLNIPGRYAPDRGIGLLKKDFRETWDGISFPGPRIDTFCLFIKNDNTDSATTFADLKLTWPCSRYLRSICDSVLIVDTTHALLGEPINILNADSLVLHQPYNPAGSNPTAPFIKLFLFKFWGFAISDCDPEYNATTTGGATNVTEASATIHGLVIAQCTNLDSVAFQYGTSPSYGHDELAVAGNYGQYSLVLDSLIPETTYHYRIVSYYTSGPTMSDCYPPPYGEFGADGTFLTSPSSSVAPEKVKGIPSSFSLAQNYPNPFNPSTEISFGLPTHAHVTLTIYDLLGRQVARLVNEDRTPGTYSVGWDASGMSGGVYLYRLTAGMFSETKKMVVMR